MFVDKKITETHHAQSPADTAIGHVANTDHGHHIFDVEFLSYLSTKISSFFGISENSMFFINLGITKHVFVLLFISTLMVLSIIGLIRNYISHKNNIPNKLMSVVELFVVYLKDDVLENFIGKNYREWASLIYTIFFFVLFANISGLIPFFDLLGLFGKLGNNELLSNLSHGGATITANANVTFAIATITFVAFIGAGIKKYGFIQHWKNLAPSGLAWPLYFVVVPIEFMGLFIRPLALTLRLAGNMMGGHIALVIFITFIFSMADSFGAWAGFGIAPFSIALAVGLTMLELLVAVIQAYVFALLTAVFIGMAINVDH
jgi:F-type H+-transporting ATPase subunit a